MELNRQALARLPIDDDYPFFTREMFSFPEPLRVENSFESLVVHFGLSLKSAGPIVESEDWLAWRSKFEHLLRQMYWIEAVMHLKCELYGDYSCYWTPDKFAFDAPVSNWSYRMFQHGMPTRLSLEAFDDA
ncbi:MAG: hypothetical protein CVV27_00675 [Candidatus Melainabacteria bacterium HGW-Melainabacteria-1]|nr:MAG: hypothetical protein CVV27_00675 [Candidatus Melainabacteria bacterium HGW-Melainabacteria-1]